MARGIVGPLLPAYFANEVTADTRALVEEFFGSDPEFGRMAGQFQALVDKQRGGADAETESAREREAFDRARMAAELPIKARTAALVWALAGLFAWFIALLTWNERMGFRNPGVLIGVCFILGAVVCFSASFFVTPESRWRALVGLDDETPNLFDIVGGVTRASQRDVRRRLARRAFRATVLPARPAVLHRHGPARCLPRGVAPDPARDPRSSVWPRRPIRRRAA